MTRIPGYGGSSWFSLNYEGIAAPFSTPPDPPEAPICLHCEEQYDGPICPCLPTEEPVEDEGLYDDIREALMDDAS